MAQNDLIYPFLVIWRSTVLQNTWFAAIKDRSQSFSLLQKKLLTKLANLANNGIWWPKKLPNWRFLRFFVVFLQFYCCFSCFFSAFLYIGFWQFFNIFFGNFYIPNRLICANNGIWKSEKVLDCQSGGFVAVFVQFLLFFHCFQLF